MNDKKFTWVPIFNNIAKKLEEFRYDRQSLLNIMYEILEELNLFNDEADKNCNFDKYQGIRCKYDDFDPFSFMNRLALYNFDNRKKFIQKFQEKTGMTVEIPEDFDGVPSVNPQLSCMIVFKDDRKETDVDDFWNLFEAALKYPSEPNYKNNFIKYYDACINKPNCRFNLSSCFFRMNGNFYISLDSINRNYIKSTFGIDIKNCPSGEEYLNLLDKIKHLVDEDERFESFIDFSYKAWLSSQNKKDNSSSVNKVWLYSPGENAMYWEECIKNKAIYIGWDELGNLKQYTTDEQIYEAIKNKYNEENPKMSKCACSDFANVIKPGDIIIAKKGIKILLGYGIVTSDYIYDDNRARFKHTRKVDWKKTGEWINNSGTGNPIKTLTEISQYKGYPEQLLSIINGGEIMNEDVNYYLVNANPKFWSFTNINVGETIDFTSTNINGHKRAVARNYISIKPGDKLIAYESTPVKAIVGLCEVVSKDNDNNIILRKTEQLINTIPYSELKEMKEIENMEYFKIQQGSLFKLEKEEYDYLYDLIREANPIAKETYEKYDETDFLNDVYINQNKYNEIVNLLKRKKNIVLQGAPGVGKTFMAKRLAYSIMGEKNSDRVELIQFHQSYSYEDFIEGFRPNENGQFDIEKGIFYNFCIKAQNDPNNDYYMIIDEINRGNISKIFGELLMLIEEDKRGQSLTLTYSKKKFFVPKNLYIIGMMNTADRSLAILDYALRRRFSFVDVLPAFDNETFIKYQRIVNNQKLNHVIDLVKILNKEIEEDPSLGKGFMIGHSYFCGLDNNCNNETIKSIIKYDILPMLKEYWFDDDSKVENWSNKLLEE